MKLTLLSDFRGGIRKDKLGLARNESADIQGFHCHNGPLETMRGVVSVSSRGQYSDEYDPNARSLGSYVTDEGVNCILARRGRGIWMGVPDVMFERSYTAVAGEKTPGWSMRDSGDVLFAEGLGTTDHDSLANYGTQEVNLWSGRVRWFDGVTSHLALTDYTQCDFNDESRSIAVWVYVDKLPSSRACVASKMAYRDGTLRGYGFYYTSTGRPGVVFKVGSSKWRVESSDATKVLAPGKWYLLAFTWLLTGTLKLYVYNSDLAGYGGEVSGYTLVEGAIANLNTTNGSMLRFGWDEYDGASYVPQGYAHAGMMGTASVHWEVLSAATLLGMFNAEQGRYTAEPSNVYYDWYPIHGASFRAASAGYPEVAYLPQRSQVCGERFEQFGDTIYCAADQASSGDYLLAIKGQIVCKGRVKGTQWVTGSSPEPWRLGCFEFVDVANETSGRRPWQLTGATGWSGVLAGTDQTILPGDTIYVRDHSRANDPWMMHGYVIKYASTGPTGSKKVWVHGPGVATAGKGEGASSDECDYVIVRAHRAGLELESDAQTTVTVADGDIHPGPQVGYWYFRWRWKDSKTGAVSPLSPISSAADVALAVTDNPTVSGWQAQPDDLRADTLQIFACVEGSGASSVPWFARSGWYLIAEISLLAEEAVTYPVSEPWINGDVCWYRKDAPDYVMFYGAYAHMYHGATETEIEHLWHKRIPLESDAAMLERPPALTRIKRYNGRLWGFEAARPWVLRGSDLNNPEQMPEIYAPIDGVTTAATGCAIQVGRAGDPVVAMEAEVGSYSDTGIVGSNLLLMTSHEAFRLYGNDWESWQLVPAFAVGCAAPNTLVNAGGLMIWVTGNDIAMVPAGGSAPEYIGNRIFPRGTQSEMYGSGRLHFKATLERWSAAFWRGHYFLLAATVGADPSVIYIFDVMTRSWVSIAGYYNAVMPFRRSDDNGQLSLLGAYNNDQTGAVREMWHFNSRFGSASWLSGPLAVVNEKGASKEKHPVVVRVCYKIPANVSALNNYGRFVATLYVYRNGDLGTPSWTSLSQDSEFEVASSPSGERAVMTFYPVVADCRYFQLKLALVYNEDTQIDWIEVENAEHA